MRREKKGDTDQYALLNEWVCIECWILNEYISNNMTDYFQALDLTGKWVKDFMKQKFHEWLATQ